jgi:hypothetical protein
MAFPVDLEHVGRTEARLGVTFPPSFVERMLTENGGEVVIGEDAWSLNPFLDTSDKTRLKRTSNDIVVETESAREWPSFPQTAVAIASNGMGDHLVLLPDPEQPRQLQAAVFTWNHETGELDQVAEDFVELV